MSSGRYSNVSQNFYIESTAKYGILYVFYYLYVLIYSIKYSLYKSFSQYNCNVLFIFLIFITILGFSVVDLFLVRTLVITFGFLIGIDYQIRMNKKYV